MLDQNLPPLNHNRGPAFDPAVIADLKRMVENAAEKGGAVLDRSAIETEAEASEVNDFRQGVSKLHKKIDAARKEAKAPWDAAAKEVQNAFTPLMEVCKRLEDRTKPMLTAFEAVKRKRIEEERRKAEAEAARQRQEAEEAARAAAARNDVLGEQEAEERAKAADAAIKDVAKNARAGFGIESASGGGRKASLRKVRKARVTNAVLALRDLRDHYPDAYAEAERDIERICSAVVRAAKGQDVSLRGIEIYEEESIA